MQGFISALVTFLMDDMLISLCVSVCCVIIAACLERRKHFNLRASATILISLLYMLVTQLSGLNGRNPSAFSPFWEHATFPIGTLKYLSLFTLYLASIPFMSRVSIFQSLYGITVAYSIQNMCERLIEIPRDTAPYFPVLLDRFCLMLLMLITITVYYPPVHQQQAQQGDA